MTSTPLGAGVTTLDPLMLAPRRLLRNTLSKSVDLCPVSVSTVPDLLAVRAPTSRERLWTIMNETETETGTSYVDSRPIPIDLSTVSPDPRSRLRRLTRNASIAWNERTPHSCRAEKGG